MTAWIWAPLWKVGSVTSAGGGEDGRTKSLSLCPGPFLSLVPGRRSSPCGPPRSSRPVSGPPRCAASAPLSTALSLCSSLSPSPPGNAGLYPHPGTSSEGVWSWTGWSVEQTAGGEATGSRRLAGKSPLYASHREGVGRAREDPGGPGTGRGWSTGCLAEEGSLHERVMPRPEPSADRWDWPIGTLRGQRSRTRGLDNLTGMDWSLPGRHRCGVDVG